MVGVGVGSAKQPDESQTSMERELVRRAVERLDARLEGAVGGRDSPPRRRHRSSASERSSPCASEEQRLYGAQARSA